MNKLFEISESLINGTVMSHKRSLCKRINWKNRLIGLKGARGTGKTTLLLQWLKEKGLPSHEGVYFSLDDLFFTTHSLVETGTDFFKKGGKILVLDEVHKYSNWAKEIKNLYDYYPTLQIIFTGSSIIDIAKQEGDLSRRAIMYELPGLSFREYLQFNNILDSVSLELMQIIEEPFLIRKKFPVVFRPLLHFARYNTHGYYPFAFEDMTGYHLRIQQLVRSIVEYDMAELKGFDVRNAKKILQLLYIIAGQVPFIPNLSKLAEKSGIHRNSLSNYLLFLEQARLIKLLYPEGVSIATLQKPEKIYLDNPNLMHGISPEKPEPGTIRETFFLNQLQVTHRINFSKRGDFIVDGKYIFEIGGKNKDTKQIKGIINSWIVKDDIEYPAGNELPLWIFGFLY